MASTVNTPHLDRSTSQSVRDNDPSQQMTDEDIPHQLGKKFYFQPLYFLLANNEISISCNSIRQIAKILQLISKKPGDKKVRQHPMQGIIIRKFVSGVQGGIEMMNILGFHETSIDGKPYLQLADDHQTITDAETIADVLMQVAAHPENILGKSKAEGEGEGDVDGDAVEETSPVTEPVSVPCAKDCGFYGSSQTMNMCSVCYKKELETNPPSTPVKSQHTISITKPPMSAEFNELLTIAEQHKRGATRVDKWARAKAKLQALHVIKSCQRPIQLDRERCWTCKRKLNLSGVECRCGYVFCGRHRYAQEHNCTFDHYKRHQSNLARSNTVIGRSKLEDDEEYD